MFKYFPCGRDKRPLFNNWQELATDNPEQLASWYEQYKDRFGMWGIPTGKANGIIALDIDAKGTKNGFQSLQELNMTCPTTMSQRTITGGMHLLYQYPSNEEHLGNRANLFKKESGVDIRGDGGYICVYNLDTSTPVTPAPEWLVKEAKGYVAPTNQDSASVSEGVALSELLSAVENIKSAAEGGRNDTLNTEAFRAARAILGSTVSVEAARKQLFEAAKSIGLGDHEINATLNSAFKGGSTKPITSPFGAPDTSLVPEIPKPEPWAPKSLNPLLLRDRSYLKRPQLFKHWSSRDIHITTADGGTGKSTMKLQEAICLATGLPLFGKFECLNPNGRTLFITAEDSSEKLTAMVGAICESMGIADQPEMMDKVINNIFIKTDSDLCLVTKTRDGFLKLNEPALTTLCDACDEIKPDLIVFDPIASFWGSEAALNDMASAVSKFMRRLMKHTDACVEMINHVGKASSSSKDMSQFAGRGGTGLPSHSRVSKALRPLMEDEMDNYLDEGLEEGESAVVVNINKFSDGSPYLNKEFLLVRKGYCFTYREIKSKEVIEANLGAADQDLVMSLITTAIQDGKEITKKQVIALMSAKHKVSKARTEQAISVLEFDEQIGLTESRDAICKDQVYELKKGE